MAGTGMVQAGLSWGCAESALMILVWIGVALLIARWFELGPLAELSWWWILSPLLVAFVWFEIVEPWLGFDKRKRNDVSEKERRERIEARFRTPGQRGSSR